MGKGEGAAVYGGMIVKQVPVLKDGMSTGRYNITVYDLSGKALKTLNDVTDMGSVPVSVGGKQVVTVTVMTDVDANTIDTQIYVIG